jgi:hypothetical protein
LPRGASWATFSRRKKIWIGRPRSRHFNLDGETEVKCSTLKAILTDAQFWVPVVALVIGILLLVSVR